MRGSRAKTASLTIPVQVSSWVGIRHSLSTFSLLVTPLATSSLGMAQHSLSLAQLLLAQSILVVQMQHHFMLILTVICGLALQLLLQLYPRFRMLVCCQLYQLILVVVTWSLVIFIIYKAVLQLLLQTMDSF